MTTQDLVVRRKAQTCHRDYHLGFMPLNKQRFQNMHLFDAPDAGRDYALQYAN